MHLSLSRGVHRARGRRSSEYHQTAMILITADTTFILLPCAYFASYHHLSLCYFTRRFFLFTKTWGIWSCWPLVWHAKWRAVLTNWSTAQIISFQMGQFWEIPGIIQNAKKEKQKQATNHVLNNNQCKLMVFAALSTSCKTSSSVNNVSFNYDDDSLVAEIYWLVKIASCKLSMRSADHIGDTFQNIFPDSKIAANFSLNNKWSLQTTISLSKQPYATRANLFQDP